MWWFARTQARYQEKVGSTVFDQMACTGSATTRVANLLSEKKKLKLGKAGQVSVLVRGNNDDVLDAVGEHLMGEVRCIYIDPPYNNMEVYEHYEDRDTHDDWIKKLTNHVNRLHRLLKEDGSLWISIDDRQVHYLKVALDGIFGRENFVSTIVWEHRKTRENRKVFSNNHEYILVYAKDAAAFKRNRNQLPYNDEAKARFKNPDNDPRGPWQSISLNVQSGHATQAQFHEIVGPSGRRHNPPAGRCWMYTADRVQELIKDNRIWFGKDGNAVPRLKRFLGEMQCGLTPHTLWKADEVGTTDTAKKEILRLFPKEPVFDTPKPTGLIDRILKIAADPGDLVLDSFLGSGTTASVALQNGMRFFGIEMGNHAVTHCHSRLKPLVEEYNATVMFFELSKRKRAAQ